MQRATASLLLLALVGSLVFVGWKARGRAGPGRGVQVVATVRPSGSEPLVVASSLPPAPTVAMPELPRLPAPGPSALEGGGVSAGRLLLSGEPPPALGPEAPKTVGWGVVLLTYQGAQSAPRDARSREAALALAKELYAEAKAKGFGSIVTKGDPGSTENAGHLPQGVLEPAPEYELFRLGRGEVGGPVETPRGFWILQRNE